MAESLRVGVLHLQIEHGAVEENRASLLHHAEEAAVRGARIILAPELAISGYSFEGREDVAPYVEEITGETVTALSRISKRFGVYICAGLAEIHKGTGIFYNSAVVLGPDGRLIAHHRKHVAERRWSSPGQPSPSSLFETPWGKIGVLICADTYYGLLPRSMALQDVGLFLICANWPSIPLDPREIWRARVLENGVGLIAANRTGVDRRMDCRSAPSYGLTPEGIVLLEATSETSQVFIIDYPLEQSRLPCRLREERMATRRPGDYHAIALDASGIEDVGGMWGLPPAGTLWIQCLVPDPHRPSSTDLAEAIEEVEGPTLFLLPPAGDFSLRDLVRYSKEKNLAIAAGLRSHGILQSVFISEGRRTDLPPDKTWILTDFPPARIALIRSEALCHPEPVVALSKQGCDILVTHVATMDDDTRLLLGAKSLERVVVAAIASDGATICIPPEGHERWQETVRRDPGICRTSVHTAFTRKKRFLDRVNLEVLLRR